MSDRRFRWQRIAVVFCASVVVALVAAWSWLLYVPPASTTGLFGTLSRIELTSGGLPRTFLSYTPRNLRPHAPLLIVLHGSTMTSAGMRETTGYAFDRLADAKGAMLVYPDGFEQHWNDCRRAASYSARTRHIDDVGFVRAIVARNVASGAVDPARVFVIGYSNGGQMALRLALEARDTVAAVGVISASLPAPSNMDCPLHATAPVAFVNGTADPINPFSGGEAGSMGSSFGQVLPAVESAATLARLDGTDNGPSATLLTHRSADDPTQVRRFVWQRNGQPVTELFAVEGGGHVVPQSWRRAPRIMGATTKDLDAPAALWEFFGLHVPVAVTHTRTSASLVWPPTFRPSFMAIL